MLRVCALFLLVACGDKSEEEDDEATADSGITTGGAEDISGNWEGVCAFPSTDISIDMVLNQKDRDVTGGVDIYFTTDKLYEFDGSVTGTVTLERTDLEMVFTDYGTIDVAADYSADEDVGERLIGSCTDPSGASGNLSLSR